MSPFYRRPGFWFRGILSLLVITVIGTAACSSPRWWPRVRDWMASMGDASNDQNAKQEDAAAADVSGGPSPDARGHAHDDLTSVSLSKQAMRNIGLKQMTVALGAHTRSITIPGVVVEQPGRSRLAVPAPMTGIVTKLHVTEGEAIAAGRPLFEMRLTHEELVQAQGEFLASVERLDVIKQELARLEAARVNIDGESISTIAGRTKLQQRYEKQTLEATLRARRQRLVLHGLTAEQVRDIEETHKLLQDLVVSAPDPNVTRLPQSVERLQVSHLMVKPGDHVNAGDPMCELSNHQELLIAGQAFAEDAEQLNLAARNNWSITAINEQASQQQIVKGLKILYLADQIDEDSRALPFYVRLPNEVIRDTEIDGHRPLNGKHYIGWRFKPGQRLRLQVPVEQLENQIVLPSSAVVQEGVEFYVFQQNGDHWDRRPIHVIHRDALEIVVAADGSIFPGDTIAASGAFEMQQHLKAQAGGGADAHAGHSH